jgi:hypothetical protein
MRVTSSTAAMLFTLGCGRETLELFPGSAASSTDANGVFVTDAESDAPSVSPNDDSGLSAQDGGKATAADAGCQTNNDCSGENPFCQTGLHICVQCLGGPNDCAGQAAESKCNVVNNTCGVPCAPDGGCPAPDVCDSHGVCTDCLTSSQCPADQPVCVDEQCVCRTSADCEAGLVCNSDQTCK